MRIQRRGRMAVALATGVLLVAACGSDESSAPAETAAASAAPTTAAAAEPTETTPAGPAETDPPADTEPVATEPVAPAGWTVDTEACVDPDSASAPIEGTIKLGSIMPLSGGPAAAFAPVAEGLTAYIDKANAEGLVPGYTIELSIEDDQYNKDLTPGAAEKLIGETEVDLIGAVIGSPNNAAIRDLLNEECVPQLNALTGSPAWGQAEDYPWTTGALVPYTDEAQIYAAQMQEQFPDGAKVAIFHVNNEFGQVYVDAFEEIAGDFGIEIVTEQTVEATDQNPPTAQVNAIAAEAPDAIMAIPLGTQCPTFLKEVANAKAANAGWEPNIYLTNTCASKLFISVLAGGAGDGVFTSNNLKDVNDPANDSDPGVKALKDAYAAAGLQSDLGTVGAGWSSGENIVSILAAAAEKGPLSRASIIEAARTITFTPSLGREGIEYRMNGLEDPFPYESLQVLQWDEAGQKFTSIGSVISQFES
jgi:branched-chain amino acid transport system substrate-binding protein